MKIKLTHMLQAHCLWQQDTKHFIFKVIYAAKKKKIIIILVLLKLKIISEIFN